MSQSRVKREDRIHSGVTKLLGKGCALVIHTPLTLNATGLGNVAVIMEE